MKSLTVGLLVACAGTGTAELLGLAAAGIGNKEGAVVCEEDALDLGLGSLIDVLLVVGNQTLGDGLADGCGVHEVG